MAERLNLVTGACGFTGSHIVKRLLDRGDKVIATDLPKAFEHPKIKFIFKNIGLDFSNPSCEVVPSDLLNKDSLKALFERPVTHVYHTASLYDYSAPIELLRRINIDGGVNLFELAAGHQGLKRFLHWSTCGIFGHPYTASSGKKVNIPFDEENSSPKNAPFDQDRPSGSYLVNDYSITKWKQEQIAWKYSRERGLPLTVIRPAPIYGPGSDYGHGGIILTINRGLLPIIPADSRNFITTSVHVEDVAGFAVFASDRDQTIGEDYNVVDDSIISYSEFLHYIALLLGRRMWDIWFVYLPLIRPIMMWAAKTWLMLERKYHVPRIRMVEVGSAPYVSSSYWIANNKTKEAGYSYMYPDVRNGLRDTIRWFRKVGWLDPSYNPQGIWQENLQNR